MFHVEHRCWENVGSCGNQGASFRRAVGAAGSRTRAPIPPCSPPHKCGQSSRKLNCHRDFLLPTPGTRPFQRVQVARIQNMILLGPWLSRQPSRFHFASPHSRNPDGLSTQHRLSAPPAPPPSDSAGVPAPDSSRPPSPHSPPPAAANSLGATALSAPGRDHGSGVRAR